MAKNKIFLFMITSLFVSACSHFQNDAVNKSIWRIEQNLSGSFVLCEVEKNCVERTAKTYFVKPKPKEVVNQTEVISTVFFPFGKSYLTKQARSVLQQTLKSLKNDKQILIRGWTDPVGGKRSIVNQKLAKQRTQTVSTWLRKNGIEKQRIRMESEPPCCNNKYATAKSSDAIRSRMRVVTIELTDN